MRMRVGIMGGTLDPVHNGHIMLAQSARELLGLSHVLLLPAGDPPHKTKITGKAHRLEMCKRAAMKHDWLHVSEIELTRSGATYTVDTLSMLTSMQADTQWVYIIGADTLAVLESWRSFEKVAKLCSFAVFARDKEAIDEAHALMLQERYGARIIMLPVAGPDISSTDIRNRVARGDTIKGLVPEDVETYIHEQGLYLCSYTREALLDMLKGTLKPSRYQHTLGVAQTAKKLAERNGIDARRAELAALLHDCAKSCPKDELLSLALQAEPAADAAEINFQQLLHAPAGSVLAQRLYGVRDREICSAIRKHTLGDADMSALEAIIYTADFIEPGRAPFPGLEEVRALAEKDLFLATLRCAELTRDYVLAQGGTQHARTQQLIEGLKHK